MQEKDAEVSCTPRNPDALTNGVNSITRIRPPVETAIDLEAAPTSSSGTREKVADVSEPPPNGGLLAWLQVLG